MPLINVERDVGPLVVAAQGGDDEAYGALVEAHWAELVRFARSVVGDQDAEDVVQEGFVAGWRDIAGVREPARFRSWMFSIVFRRCLRWKKWRRAVLSLMDAPTPSTNPDPSVAIDVAGLLRRLAPAQRAVLHLTVVEGLTDTEIGEVLDTAPGTVRAHRRRARDRMAVLAGGHRHA